MQKGWDFLFSFHGLIATSTPVIAFSGGRDSAVLLHFYQYLYARKLCPAPVLYHLDHSIRDNAEQEERICRYMQASGLETICKKKTFPKSANP